MALTTGKRKAITAALMRAASQVWDDSLGELSSDEIEAAVVASDDWLDAATASYNTALPQPYRGVAGSSEKALMLCIVAAAQYMLDDPEAANVFRALAGMLARHAVGG